MMLPFLIAHRLKGALVYYKIHALMKDLTFRQKVIQGIHDLFYIWKREFGTTFRDQGVLIFFVLVPLVYPLIYAFIYTNETIQRSAHCRGG